jgi:dihydrodipicolinate synthase/N-acetylneuraminate lyase
MMTLPRPLRGIIPPVLTPLSGRDTLDVPAFERLLDHLITGGSSALFILGSTGEAPGLSYRLRREAVDRACAVAGARIPILVGITDTAFVESVNAAEYAAKAGASALVLSPPFYYTLSQSAFLGYLERLVPLLPLPLYLYNMPSYTKLVISPETVRAAAAIPGVYGLKDSSGDRAYFRACRAAASARPDFAFLGGVEEILAELVAEGAHGGVCGGANLFPRLYVQLYEAAVRGDRDLVARLQKIVLTISCKIYTVGESGSSYLRGLKTAASILGIGDGYMAEPYQSLSVEDRQNLDQALSEVRSLLSECPAECWTSGVQS